jgi:hypothetical protein
MPLSSMGGHGPDIKALVPHPDIVVSPGTIRDAEQSLLTASSTIVAQYEQLKPVAISSAASGMWGQNEIAAYQVGPPTSATNHQVPRAEIYPTAVADNAKQFLAVISPIQEEALAHVASVMSLVSSYIEALNQAAEGYVHADRSSFLTTAGESPLWVGMPGPVGPPQ